MSGLLFYKDFLRTGAVLLAASLCHSLILVLLEGANISSSYLEADTAM